MSDCVHCSKRLAPYDVQLDQLHANGLYGCTDDKGKWLGTVAERRAS